MINSISQQDGVSSQLNMPNNNAKLQKKSNQKVFDFFLENAVRQQSHWLANEPLDQDHLSNTVFPILMKRFAILRNDIAHLLKEEQADCFGVRRDISKLNGTLNYGTTFFKNGRYGDYNQEICNWLIEIIRKKKKKKRAIKNVKVENNFDQIYSSITIRMLTKEDLVAPLAFPKWFPLDIFYTRDPNDQEKEKLDQAFLRLRQEEPKVYDRYKLLHTLKEFMSRISCSYDAYIIADAELQEGENRLSTTRYVTGWTKADKLSPLEHIGKEAAVHLEHQDKYLIKQSLDEIAKLFANALYAGRDNKIVEMQTNMALMHYIFSNCCPFIRGSAAIGELLSYTVYASCGLKVEWLQKPDLVALSQPLLSLFMERYPKILKLTAMSLNLPIEIQENRLPNEAKSENFGH